MKTEEEKLEYINKVCDTDYQSMDEVKWQWLSSDVKLPELFIKEFEDKVDWDYISIFQTLSETFIIEFENKLKWNFIWRNQNVSQYFIQKYGLEHFHANLIKYCTVPLDTISKLKHHVSWSDVIKHQVLTEKFIWVHKVYFDMHLIKLIETYQQVSPEFIEKLIDCKKQKH